METPQCSVQADDVFGPTIASSCRGGFDFTLLFEQALLGIAPAVIFALAFPPRFAYLARTETKTLAGPLRVWKLVDMLSLSLSLSLSLPHPLLSTQDLLQSVARS